VTRGKGGQPCSTGVDSSKQTIAGCCRSPPRAVAENDCSSSPPPHSGLTLFRTVHSGGKFSFAASYGPTILFDQLCNCVYVRWSVRGATEYRSALARCRQTGIDTLAYDASLELGHCSKNVHLQATGRIAFARVNPLRCGGRVPFRALQTHR